MDQYDLEQHMKALAEHLARVPADMPQIKRWYKNTVGAHANNVLVVRLHKCPGWSNFSWGVMSAMANDVDAPFLRCMLRLSADRILCDVISMHRWWRRMKAMDQSKLLTYLDYTSLLESLAERFVDHTMILPFCLRSREALQQLTEAFESDTQLDLVMRAKLGASMATDIKSAWIRWAKENHPDKGGDTDTFIITKACYDEWLAVQPQET